MLFYWALTRDPRRASERRLVPGIHPGSVRRAPRLVAWTLSLLLATVGPAVRVAAQDTGDLDLSGLSLEELMGIEVEVTSVSRKAEALSDTAAAVAVLSAEDIRRSGATSLPEALRLVPGVHVARVNANSWAVGIRGFNGQFSNKLLVLIDGRSVYTPVFSGVYWDIQDVMLEDVERIEVIRGPGSVAWGANAVDGVINVITRDASHTQGDLASLTLGDEEHWILAARHGGELGADGHYRAWGKAASHDALRARGGGTGNDAWRMSSGGFRYDGDLDLDGHRSVQVGAYAGSVDLHGRFGSAVTPPFVLFPATQDVAGAHVLGRWDWDLSDDESLTIQSWFDQSTRDGSFGRQTLETGDVELTHRVGLGDADEVVWGLNYRYTQSHMRNVPAIGFLDPERVDRIASGFASYEHELLPDMLAVTVGAKLEDTSAGGSELLPSLRLRYTPTDRRTFWGAASRAVRTPSLAERSVVFDASALPPPPVTIVSTIVGSQDLESERLSAYELGWREELSDTLSVDLATFYNQYDDLVTVEPGTPTPIAPGVFQVPLPLDNKAGGRSYGTELAMAWAPTEAWELDASYSWQRVDVDLDADSVSPPSDEGDRVPRQMAHLRSHHILTEATDLDLLAWYVGAVEAFAVDAYVRLDCNVTHRLGEATTFQLGVANLLHDGGPEWGGENTNAASEVQRSTFLRVTHRF